jgi:hypothetical protein
MKRMREGALSPDGSPQYPPAATRLVPLDVANIMERTIKAADGRLDELHVPVYAAPDAPHTLAERIDLLVERMTSDEAALEAEEIKRLRGVLHELVVIHHRTHMGTHSGPYPFTNCNVQTCRDVAAVLSEHLEPPVKNPGVSTPVVDGDINQRSDDGAPEQGRLEDDQRSPSAAASVAGGRRAAEAGRERNPGRSASEQHPGEGAPPEIAEHPESGEREARRGVSFVCRRCGAVAYGADREGWRTFLSGTAGMEGRVAECPDCTSAAPLQDGGEREALIERCEDRFGVSVWTTAPNPLSVWLATLAGKYDGFAIRVEAAGDEEEDALGRLDQLLSNIAALAQHPHQDVEPPGALRPWPTEEVIEP